MRDFIYAVTQAIIWVEAAFPRVEPQLRATLYHLESFLLDAKVRIENFQIALRLLIGVIGGGIVLAVWLPEKAAHAMFFGVGIACVIAAIWALTSRVAFAIAAADIVVPEEARLAGVPIGRIIRGLKSSFLMVIGTAALGIAMAISLSIVDLPSHPTSRLVFLTEVVLVFGILFLGSWRRQLIIAAVVVATFFFLGNPEGRAKDKTVVKAGTAVVGAGATVVKAGTAVVADGIRSLWLSRGDDVRSHLDPEKTSRELRVPLPGWGDDAWGPMTQIPEAWHNSRFHYEIVSRKFCSFVIRPKDGIPIGPIGQGEDVDLDLTSNSFQVQGTPGCTLVFSPRDPLP